MKWLKLNCLGCGQSLVVPAKQLRQGGMVECQACLSKTYAIKLYGESEIKSFKTAFEFNTAMERTNAN